jgi:hypothetical protein
VPLLPQHCRALRRKVKPDARGRVTRVNQRARWKAGAVYRRRLTPGQLKRRRDPGGHLDLFQSF